MTARVEAERAIADVLAGHMFIPRTMRQTSTALCICGHEPREIHYPTDAADYRAHLASVLADLMAERQAEALGDAADAWQQGQWSDALSGTQRPSQVQARIATAQAVTDWLRSRAEAHERPPVDIPDPKDTRDEH